MTRLVDRLRSYDLLVFLDALQEAVAGGEEGEAALVEVLNSLDGYYPSIVATALGEAVGTAGPAALRGVLQRVDAWPAFRGAAVLALAKRCGVAASAEFVAALDAGEQVEQEGDRTLLEQVVVSLAGAGDDRAWERVFTCLQRHLGHGTRRFENPFRQDLAALCYLARHLGSSGSERSTSLVGLIRRRWNNLDAEEQAWLERFWPEGRPAGPAPETVAPPHEATITEWVRQQHFGPLPALPEGFQAWMPK